MTIRSSVSRRRFLPALEALESRWTPATASYNAVTQQLSIVADSDDTITISQASGKPTGFLQVSDGSSTIFSGSKFVRHIRADLRNDQFSNLTISNQTKIAGNVTVLGGSLVSSTTVGTLSGNGVWIGGSFTFIGTGIANDDITINQLSIVAGGVNIYGGEGQNYSSLKGYHYGSLFVSGGGGGDTVSIASLSVGGNVSFNLGGGSNSFGSSSLFHVGGNLSYTGGDGGDSFTVPTGSDVDIGGNLVVTLGPAVGTDSTNSVNLRNLTVAGSVAVTGGNGGESVWIEDDVFIGKNLSLALRHGDNDATVDFDSEAIYIKGSAFYSGGNGRDRFDFNDLHLNGNLSVLLGDNYGPSGQKLETGGGILTMILGSVSVTGGRHADLVELEDTLIGKSVFVNTGVAGSDVVRLEGSIVTGSFTALTGAGTDTVDMSGLVQGSLFISTGAGADTVDLNNIDVQGPATISSGADNDTIRVEELGDTTLATFGNGVTFLGGTGVDTLRIGAGVNSFARFGGKVIYNGGLEADIFPAPDAAFEAGFTGVW